MARAAVLIDFGSTFTKVTVVDLETARIVGRTEAPTTVETGVHHGLSHALDRLAAAGRLPSRGRAGLDLLDGHYVRASSSAAGGLRIVVIGNVPGLTVEAGNAAALGAGAKVVGAFGFKLGDEEREALLRLRPDLVLLAGGAEGGDTATILHNARVIAASSLAVPIIVAGNSAARDEACSILQHAGKQVTYADNVMPAAGTFAPEAARSEIRRLFMARIVTAKGFETLAPIAPIVQATPDAVLSAASLAARGTGDRPGWGELMLVDIGGATTDVHSIGNGTESGHNVVPKGMPEPYEKRTVEGDLGIRVNADTIVSRVGEEVFVAQYASLFPKLPAPAAKLVAYAHEMSRDTGRTPTESWQLAADATLARLATDLAIARHVGHREPFYAKEGLVWLQSGKNLTEAQTLIGTGGIFAHNPHADRILSGGERSRAPPRVLRPLHPRLLHDRSYLMHVAGLLAADYPAVAKRLLDVHLLDAAAPHGQRHASFVPHGHAHDDCCDGEH